MTTITIAPEILANCFSTVLRRELSDHKMNAIIAANDINDFHGHNDVCATHDYLDANECMLLAMKNLGVKYDANDAAVTDLINKAWEIARTAKFTLVDVPLMSRTDMQQTITVGTGEQAADALNDDMFVDEDGHIAWFYDNQYPNFAALWVTFNINDHTNHHAIAFHEERTGTLPDLFAWLYHAHYISECLSHITPTTDDALACAADFRDMMCNSAKFRAMCSAGDLAVHARVVGGWLTGNDLLPDDAIKADDLDTFVQMMCAIYGIDIDDPQQDWGGVFGLFFDHDNDLLVRIAIQTFWNAIIAYKSE